MNDELIKTLSETINIDEKKVRATLNLLENDCTIPFIARYRKEVTGGLNEEEIKLISDEYQRNVKLLERKLAVIKLIDEKGMLTEELKSDIMSKTKLVEVEDLYLPYKEKKKTKATEAIALGLTPLAKKIMSFPLNGTLENLASGYNMSADEAILNAGYIISEWISENAYYRKWIRNYIYNNGYIVSKVKSKHNDDKKIYEMYYDFKEQIKYLKHYRCLGINRAENEKVVNVSLDFDKKEIESFLESKVIKNKVSFVVDNVKECIKDSLKRLILPSIEREIRGYLTERSEDKAIITFSKNLTNLLMTRPIKGKVVMGFDPAFRTGCKLAIINEQGALLDISVIYPHEPQNDKVGSVKELRRLIDKYNVSLIAIGNGTASRESEAFVAEAIKGLNVKYIIVSEAGASVYSASKLAIKEFPSLTVEKRSAISIGRRIQDPLSELVKIDPKSIGVGEYQHDVDQKKLSKELDYTVLSVVNKVGVNLNTASESILKYVSGITKKCAENIMEYKSKDSFKNREELLKVKGVTPKIFEQAIGFLRVPSSINPLDNTGVHPENYADAEKLLNYLKLNINDIRKEEFKNMLEKSNIKEICKNTGINEYLVNDIIKELKNPGLDLRDELDMPLLRSDVLHIEDLKVGMNLEGTVRNVASFGAFVDIGLKNDALLHISKISKEFIKDASDILSVGDIIKCKIDKIDLNKSQVSLSII